MKYNKDYWNDVGQVASCIPNLVNLKIRGFLSRVLLV